ncbi:hypothetical protein SAMN04488581_3621 [Mycolicibacterium neoaurum]|uniref:hypothetical protein n=1 Tax=Mycolicibacterium neoaurum TaxID=1795 RepID=UPI0005675437|nr:hypothetical protein [Mycolicibacterium neoaurum]SDE22904.1 hypothetical protein SAMN04488581_3621 [Mycolicibacterium neoaurum]
MSIETAEIKRFFTMDEVLAHIRAVGIAIDEETVEYHLYRTRKMPAPAKKVKRERYWTAEQIESFIAEL